jgi:hypothetical protein
VVPETPAWGLPAGGADEWARFACVKSVRRVTLDCPPIAARDYGDEFRQLLYSGERAARGAAFRAIAAEPWDAFLTTDVTAAPFAHALPRSTWKVLAAGDGYARRAAVAARAPAAVRAAEERFAFARIEAELYRLFDRVACPSEADAQRARGHGASATRVAPPVAPARAADAPPAHDLLVSGGTGSGPSADLEWFYRHIYVPHLRSTGAELAVAGPVAARFAVCDRKVVKVPAGEAGAARVVVAPACEASGPHAAVADALAAGRAVVATPEGVRGFDVPDDAAVVIDMRADPAGTAAVIRDLLAAPGWCRVLGARAAELTGRHTRHRFFTALDSLWRPALAARGRTAEAA